MKLLKYILPAVLVGLFIAGGVHALSISLPSRVYKGDLLVGSTTNSSLFNLATGTAGSVLYVNPATSLPAWTATSTLGISGGASLSGGSTNSLPIWTSATGIGNSSISQSGGTTLINGVTPIIDGGGDWLNNIIQSSGANFIAQSPTSTAALGNLVQGGGVTNISANTTLSGTQVCSGGLYTVSGTSGATTLTLPGLSVFANSPCGSTIYSGSFSSQYQTNLSGFPNTFAVASPTTETILYAPGSGPILYPGQTYNATGQFIATSTMLGATSTGMTFQSYLQIYQPTSTQPTTMGQILSGDATGHGWQLTNLTAGTNIAITTTTPGQITLGLTGVVAIANGGTATSTTPAASAVLVGNGTNFDYATLPSCSDATNSKLLFNNTTRLFSCGTDQAGGSGAVANGSDGFVTRYTGTSTISTGILLDNGTVAGVKATSSTVTFNVQGASAVDPFNVSSSTGTSLLTVLGSGFVGIGTSTPLSPLSIVGGGFGTLRVENSNTAGVSLQLRSTDTGGNIWHIISNASGNAGGAGHLQFYDQTSNKTVMILQSGGNVGIGSSTPGAMLAIKGISAAATPLLVVSSSSNASYLTVTPDGVTTINSLTLTSPLTVANGGTGATTLPAAKAVFNIATTTIATFNLNFANGVASTTAARINASSTLVGYSVVGNASCTGSVDIWKRNNAYPAVANTIVSGTLPGLSAAQISTSYTLTSWTTAFQPNDFIMASSSSASCSTITVTLEGYR